MAKLVTFVRMVQAQGISDCYGTNVLVPILVSGLDSSLPDSGHRVLLQQTASVCPMPGQLKNNQAFLRTVCKASIPKQMPITEAGNSGQDRYSHHWYLHHLENETFLWYVCI